jgi:hypothetical protein
MPYHAKSIRSVSRVMRRLATACLCFRKVDADSEVAEQPYRVGARLCVELIGQTGSEEGDAHGSATVRNREYLEDRLALCLQREVEPVVVQQKEREAWVPPWLDDDPAGSEVLA